MRHSGSNGDAARVVEKEGGGNEEHHHPSPPSDDLRTVGAGALESHSPVSTMASPAVVAHPRWRAPCAARHGTTSRRSSGLRCGCGRCPAALTNLIPALPIVDECLRGRSCWLVNYARRYRAGLRVGTSVTEGTANFLVNRRMNKSQQMRWSPSGADLLLQVRCAVFNGTFGSGFGDLFSHMPTKLNNRQGRMIPHSLDTPATGQAGAPVVKSA